MRVLKSFSFLAIILFVASCSIVSVDEVDAPVAGETPDIAAPPAEDEGIDTGSGAIPTDSALFVLFLNDDSVKVWEASDFLLEGVGISMTQSCREDDIITFNADGTFFYESGAWLCGAEDTEETREGTYSFDLEPENPTITFTFELDGVESSFTGIIWTLEEDFISLSGAYVSSVFGSFEVTGAYTSSN